MSDQKSILMSISNVSIMNSIISKLTTYNYITECNNNATIDQLVTCSPALDRIPINSVQQVILPFGNFNFTGFNTNSSFAVGFLNYTVPSNLGLNQSSYSIIETSASWSLLGNAITSSTLISNVVDGPNYINITLPDETCVSINYEEKNYLLSADIKAVASMQIIENNVHLSNQILLNQSTSLSPQYNYTLVNENMVEFVIVGKMQLNIIISNITRIVPIFCYGMNVTQIPVANFTTPAPVTLAVSRFGFEAANGNEVTNVTAFGFPANIWNTNISNYKSLNLYNTMVIDDNCFKVRIFIYIPPFIVFPLWIDETILADIVGGFSSAVNSANSALSSAVQQAKDLSSQISLKNAVALGTKAEVVAKAIVTGKANRDLLDAAKAVIQSSIDEGEAILNYNNAIAAYNAAEELVNAVNDLANGLAEVANFLKNLGAGNSASQGTIKLMASSVQAVLQTLKDINTLVNNLPPNPVTPIIKKTINDIENLFNLVIEKAKNEAKNIDPNNPLQVAIGVLEVLINLDVIKQIFTVAMDLDTTQLAYEAALVALDALRNNVAVTTLNKIAAESNQTQLEKVLGEAASDAASSADSLITSGANIMQLKALENLAFDSVASAQAAISSVTNGINNAVLGSVEGNKRGHISDTINAYITRDLYKISTIGSFDPLNPKDKQTLINDINGASIYTKDGVLLWRNSSFCNQPFVKIKTEYNSNGCNSGSDACGLGPWVCGELNFNDGPLKYRISFDFYDNHDLSKGGIKVGDFDNDGVDDLWCHYPGTTKNYNPATANAVIFSPLKQNFYLNIEISGWCQNGIVKTCDFNGDLQGDVLCITDSSLYLLYGYKGSFISSSNNPNGLIPTNYSTSIWNTKSKVVPGDFDGDGKCDLLQFSATTIDILYSDPVLYFISQSNNTNTWSSNITQASISNCFNTDVNRILVADLNNDKKSDMVCITNTNLYTPPIYSQVPTSLSSYNKIVVVVNQVVLQPINYAQDIKRSINLEQMVLNNKIVNGDQVLIGNNEIHLNKELVENIHISLGCLGLEQFPSEINLLASTILLVDNNLFGNYGNTQPRTVNLDVSAKWVNGSLIDIESNIFNSLDLVVQAPTGSALNTEVALGYITIQVSYTATASVFIETAGDILKGEDLEVFLERNFGDMKLDTSGSFAVVPVEGFMYVNLLGVGYTEIQDYKV